MTRPIKPRRNPAGRPSTHAGRALERVSRKNLWDKRTTIFRARCDIANGIVNDFFGDWSEVGALDALVWGAADTQLILDSISGYVAKQGGPITATGELLPVLRKGFIAYQNALRLHLQALAELAKSRRESHKGPSLAEYIASRYPADAKNGAPGSAGGPQSAAAAPAESLPTPDADSGPEAA